MGLDPDPFDDIFVDNTAKNYTRAGGKFQPKANRGPTRKESAVSSSPSSQPSETDDSAKNKSNVALQTKKASEPYNERSLEPVKPLENVAKTESVDHTVGIALNDNERCLESVNPVEHAANGESVDHSVSAPPESDVLVTEGHSCFEKSVGENADIFFGLESLEFLPHSTKIMDSSTPTETPAIPDNQNAKDRLASPVISHATDSGCMSNITDNPTCPELSPAEDPLTRGQPIVSINEGGCNMHDGSK